MAGDHACPVCNARFTRPQHVTRHMRSHTGDRPYKCTQCGDQFARSDLLSRHVNKCHSGMPTSSRAKKNAQHASMSSTTNPLNLQPHNLAVETSCDQCLQLRFQCDLGAPCGKCLARKSQCTYIAKASKLPGISPAIAHAAPTTYATSKRTSLPSILPQQQRDYLFGPTSSIPYSSAQNAVGGPQQAFGNVNGYQPNFSAAPPSTTASYYDDQQRYYAQHSNVLPGLNDLGRLPTETQNYALQQPYNFGGSMEDSPLPNTLPALAMSDGGFVSDGSPDLRALANTQQVRRNSVNLPVKPGDEPYHFSSSFQQNQQPSYHPYASTQPDSMASSSTFGPYATSSNQTLYAATGPEIGASRVFDGARVNERLMASSGGVGGINQQQYGLHNAQHPRTVNGYVLDDASSVSDFDGSNGSGHPSPVPSSQSLSGLSAVSSRRTSSPGSSLMGVSRFQHPESISNNGSDGFGGSLQGQQIPLPTPLQMHSFGGGEQPGMYPPYQSFDNMKIDEASSFAAAARNAGPDSHPGYHGQNLAGMNVLSAGGKERAINELKDFWSAFISEPLTGGTPGAHGNPNSQDHQLTKQTSMPSLKTPMPLSSERSSILGGNFNGELGNGSPTPRGLYPAGGSSVLGMSLGAGAAHGGSSLNPNHSRKKSGGIGAGDNAGDAQAQAQKQDQGQQRIGAVPSAEDQEALRKYQEACLKRETPMLKLMARPKSRAPSKSTSTSPQAMTRNVNDMAGAGEKDGMTSAPQTKSTNPTGVTPLRGVNTLGSFAEPFPPDSKQARDWSAQYPRGSSNASGVGSHGRSMSVVDPPTYGAERPSYKRLPSQTLGPEHTKKQAMAFYGDNDTRMANDKDHEHYPAPSYPTSVAQPGYGVNSAAGVSQGGAQGAWTRQRSLSSPSSARTFDWQSMGNAAVGR